jgi:hypothetical protein
MKKGETNKISRLLTQAREDGLIPWDWIVDESREMERQAHWRDLESYGNVVARSYRRDFWAHQRYRVIVVSEKATVAGILRPVLEQYGVPFFAVHGFNSATKMHELAEEIAADPRITVLIYVGDHDCSGMYMIIVDLPTRLTRYGAKQLSEDAGDISMLSPGDGHGFLLRRVALIKGEDTKKLPSFPANKDDKRYAWYKAHYGDKAWELDAMNPNTLRSRVGGEVEKYMQPGDWQRHKQIEAVQRETTRKIAHAMAAAN